MGSPTEHGEGVVRKESPVLDLLTRFVGDLGVTIGGIGWRELPVQLCLAPSCYHTDADLCHAKLPCGRRIVEGTRCEG